jgi:hypothetical protein
VLEVLRPIWQAKTETASRLRGRIEVVLSWARTQGYRSGENPAAWRGHLENLLPPRRKVRQVRHLSALPYQRESPTESGFPSAGIRLVLSQGRAGFPPSF